MDTVLIPISFVLSAVVVTSVAYRWLRRRPRTRTSARDRLIALNPTLNAAGVRWSVAAERIRIGWVTKLAVAAAVFVAVGRPVRQPLS